MINRGHSLASCRREIADIELSTVEQTLSGMLDHFIRLDHPTNPAFGVFVDYFST